MVRKIFLGMLLSFAVLSAAAPAFAASVQPQLMCSDGSGSSCFKPL